MKLIFFPPGIKKNKTKKKPNQISFFFLLLSICLVKRASSLTKGKIKIHHHLLLPFLNPMLFASF